ncbi:MAG TPA: hypothetical protein VHV32_15930, partial [Candidatus Angelobacter sp.]|nr:hypothetical protein [Candidatus Angelobacter sp.]
SCRLSRLGSLIRLRHIVANSGCDTTCKALSLTYNRTAQAGNKRRLRVLVSGYFNPTGEDGEAEWRLNGH